MCYDQIKAAAREFHDFTLESRRWLHAHPELSFKEHKTAEYISGRLAILGIEHRPIAGTGVLAKIEGWSLTQGENKRGGLKKCVVLRADIDALPIDEAPGCGFESQNRGVMHACGHDIHAAASLRFGSSE